jgi:hypothetical protein
VLRIVAGAALSSALVVGAIGLSDTVGQGWTDVNRAAKGDRLPLPKVQPACPKSASLDRASSCHYKNTPPSIEPGGDRSVRIVNNRATPNTTSL